jgi:integrase
MPKPVIAAISIVDLVEEFLRDFLAGELPGKKPMPNTVALYRALLLGKRGGFVGFASSLDRTTTKQLDEILLLRWLESERLRASAETLRLRLIAGRRLIEYAKRRGFVSAETLVAAREVTAPKAARVARRTRQEGVASRELIAKLLDAMKPRRRGSVPYHRIAELQFRLGLRRGEVIALDAHWLREGVGEVHVLVDDAFETKNHESRIIDGVDKATFALAREVVALKAKTRVTVSAYREAFDRACERLARAGTPWPFTRKTHALRSAYAVASRHAGVALSTVALRLGHASERTTERHYFGRTGEAMGAPFADVDLISS